MTASSLLSTRSISSISPFARRAFLPLRAESLWQIETGIVRTLTVLEDGTSVTMGLWGPGNVVGRALSTADPYQIECLTPVEATLLPKDNWHEMPEALILHIQQAEEIIQILHYRQAETSLLKLLSWLAKRFGQEVEQGKLIDLRLTHQDIADLIGITRVTVTRLLKDFEQHKIIQRQARSFILLQPSFWYYEI